MINRAASPNYVGVVGFLAGILGGILQGFLQFNSAIERQLRFGPGTGQGRGNYREGQQAGKDERVPTSRSFRVQRLPFRLVGSPSNMYKFIKRRLAQATGFASFLHSRLETISIGVV